MLREAVLWRGLCSLHSSNKEPDWTLSNQKPQLDSDLNPKYSQRGQPLTTNLNRKRREREAPVGPRFKHRSSNVARFDV